MAVPAMWDNEARGIMSTSAYNAGFRHCNLREEPQCVAGAVMYELQHHRKPAVRQA
jgi:molecular chaperone DnaK (HSP70)